MHRRTIDTVLWRWATQTFFCLNWSACMCTHSHHYLALSRQQISDLRSWSRSQKSQPCNAGMIIYQRDEGTHPNTMDIWSKSTPAPPSSKFRNLRKVFESCCSGTCNNGRRPSHLWCIYCSLPLSQCRQTQHPQFDTWMRLNPRGLF